MSHKTKHPTVPPPRPPAPAVPPAPVTASTMTLVKNLKQPVKANAVVYQIPGLRGTIRFVKTLFAGDAPERLTVEGATFAAPKPKLTPEERAAARAAMTLAQKVEQERARVARAQKRLAKLEAAL